MRQIIKCFGRDEAGATAIEYGLIAAFIGLAIITAAQAVGVELSSVYGAVETGLKKRVAV